MVITLPNLLKIKLQFECQGNDSTIENSLEIKSMCSDFEYKILWIESLIYNGLPLIDKAVTMLVLWSNMSEMLG